MDCRFLVKKKKKPVENSEMRQQQQSLHQKPTKRSVSRNSRMEKVYMEEDFNEGESFGKLDSIFTTENKKVKLERIEIKQKRGVQKETEKPKNYTRQYVPLIDLEFENTKSILEPPNKEQNQLAVVHLDNDPELNLSVNKDLLLPNNGTMIRIDDQMLPVNDVDTQMPDTPITNTQQTDAQQNEDKCFLCKYYNFSNEVPEGPVLVLLKSIENMFADAGTSIKEIGEQSAKYYEENIFIPCVENGISLPRMPPKMWEKHFYKHIPHNPTVHIITSFNAFKFLQYKVLNKCCYITKDEQGNQIGDEEIDDRKVELSMKLQMILDRIQTRKPSDSPFGKDDNFTLRRKGAYLNYGDDKTADYLNKFNSY